MTTEQHVIDFKPLPAQRRFLNAPEAFTAFIGGIGSGKTLAGTVKSMMQPESSRGMIIAPTYPMLKDATLHTFMEHYNELVIDHNKADKRVLLSNGTEILFRSADNPDRLRGPNLGWFWLDEAAMMPEEVWDIMIGRLRLSPGRAWVTTTPRGKNWVYKTFAEHERDEYAVARGSSRQNRYLPDAFIESLESKYTQRFLQQEVEGRFLEFEGALWRYESIRRAGNVPPLDRVVIGVDPAGGGPDETGIIVAGKAGDHFYVLADGSMRGSPNAWASRVVALYRQHKGDRVVAEKNYGGDMVEATLRTADRTLPVRMVSSSRGKALRAEPIAALYEQQKVFHVDTFDELEAQMTQWDPNERGKSPDRLDALVFALTELAGGGGGILVY